MRRVRDAVISVVLRGTAHPATAETDGSYSLQTPDLRLPGAAAVDFQISQGSSSQSLKGTLDVAAAAGAADDRNANRQLWWWVLNFAVCGAAFWLFSRRKAAKSKEPADRLLKTLHRLHQELDFLNSGDIGQGKCEIDVQHIAQA